MWSHKLATFGMPSIPHWRNWNRNDNDDNDNVNMVMMTQITMTIITHMIMIIAKNFAILGCFQYHTGATGTVIFTMILWLCLSPFGCLQYHTGTTGTVIMKFQRRMVVIMMLFVHVCRSFDTGRNYSKVRSFNFLSSSYDHLQSQDYTVSSIFFSLLYFNIMQLHCHTQILLYQASIYTVIPVPKSHLQC